MIKNTLYALQKSKRKKFRLIVFEFTIYKAEINAIYILFFEKKDLLLFANISFRKSLIFQILLFFILVLRVVLTLILLKLLQIEQNELINKLSRVKNIIFNSKNCSNIMFIEVFKGRYIYVFLSLKIAITKRVKKYIIHHIFFTDYLCLLFIDDIN